MGDGSNAPPPINANPATIEQVIAELEKLLTWSKESSSRIGFFACLYLDVTKAIRQAMVDGVFDNPARIEQLDVVFAGRYLTALKQFQTGGTPTGCWGFAFATCRRWWPTVMQHLIIAANAHINLDLGVAVAEVVPAAELTSFEPDFETVNSVLASLVPTVENGLGLIFPLLARITKLFGLEESWLIDLNMKIARARAWTFAQNLAILDPLARQPIIARKENDVLELARFLRWPGFFLGCLLGLVRLGERWTVRRRIEALEQRVEKRRQHLRQRGHL
jgi:Family of unknown function (DUF5995)